MRPSIKQDVSRFQNGPFNRSQVDMFICDSKRSSFITFISYSSLTRRPWSFRVSEWRRLEVANRSSNLIFLRKYLLPDRIYMQYNYTVVQHVPHQQYSWHKAREQLVHGTPVQMLRAQTEAVAYYPTLVRPSARNSRYGIGRGRCGGCVSRQELSTTPSYCCCCEPEFYPALLLIESRHDALNLPSTPWIRVPSPLAWGRNNVRELRAQKRHLLGERCRPFRTAVRWGYLLRYAACYKYLAPVPGTW